jgi:hypothetical protein
MRWTVLRWKKQVMLVRKMRSRFGQPNRDGSEEEPEPGKEQGVYKRLAASEQTGAVQGNKQAAESRDGRNRGSVDGNMQQEAGGTGKRFGGRGPFRSSPGRRAGT